jgi:hypothetical protein
MKLRNRLVRASADQQAIDGIRKDLPAVPALYLGGRTFTPAGLEAFFQARIDAAAAILAARAAWVDAAAKYEAMLPDTELVRRSLQAFVEGFFGPASPRLADFGFVPRKKTVLTDAQKAQAVAKRAATRKRRGTMGRKAKLAIKGQVPPASSDTK